MITVSEEWKKLHKENLLPETFVEIRLDVTDVDVTDLVTVSGSNQATFSNTSTIINVETPEAEGKYAFLEHNLWVLDGSVDVLESVETYEATGFVSKNNNECSLKISLSEIRSEGTPGFRILWSSEYGEYATKFTVEVKFGDESINSVTVVDNTENMSQVELDASDYDTVTVTVHEWSVPDHRMRIDGLVFGAAIVFNKDQILSYSHEQTGDPLGSEISKNSIEFSVDNTDGRWDLLNPGSLERYLYERQPLIVRYGMQTNTGVEWIQGGKFYLTEWRAPSNGLEATFVARDAFEFLLNGTYSRPSLDGVVMNPSVSNGSVTNNGILVFSTIDGIHDAAGTVVTTLPIGTDVNVYERINFARRNGNDLVGVLNTKDYIGYRIDQGWIHGDCVEITSDESLYADLKTALSSNIDVPITWTYSNMLADTYAATSIPETNAGSFVQTCVNKCRCTMWQKADGRLYFMYPQRTLTDYVIPAAMSYFHPEVELAKPLKQIKVVSHIKYGYDSVTDVFNVNDNGEIITIDNPYLWAEHPELVQGMADDHGKWWKHRGLVSGEFRADPRLELFDVVSVESKYGLISPVMITQIKYTYNGSFHGTYKGKILSSDLLETTSANEVTDNVDS